MNLQWYNWAKRVQTIADNGLTFAESPFDIERYEMLQHMAREIRAKGADADITELKEIDSQEFRHYSTPKVGGRGVVFRNDALLLVREYRDNCWILPGGWVDVGESPSEAIVREIYEESGYRTRVLKLLAIYNRNVPNHRLQFLYNIYSLFFLCELIGGSAATSIETSDVGFFDEDKIPEELSLPGVTPAQITRLFEHYRHPEWPTDYD